MQVLAIFLLGWVVTRLLSLRASPAMVKQKGKSDESYYHQGKHIRGYIFSCHFPVVF